MPKTIAFEQLGITEEEKESPPFWFDDDEDSILSDDETDARAQPFYNNVMAYMEDCAAPCGEAFWGPVLGDYCCNEETFDSHCGDGGAVREACRPWSDSEKMPTEPTFSLLSSFDSTDKEDDEMKDEWHVAAGQENAKFKDELRVSKKDRIARSVRHISESRLGRPLPTRAKEKLPAHTGKDIEIDELQTKGLRKPEAKDAPEETEAKETAGEPETKVALVVEPEPRETTEEPETKETSEEPERDSLDIPESLWEELMQAVTQPDVLDEEVTKVAHATDNRQTKSIEKSPQAEEVSKVVDEPTNEELAPKVAKNEIGMKQPEIEITQAQPTTNSERLQSNDKHSKTSIKASALAAEHPEKSHEEEDVPTEQAKAVNESPRPIHKEATSKPNAKQPMVSSEERESFDEQLKNAHASASKPVDKKPEGPKMEKQVEEPEMKKKIKIKDGAPISFYGADVSTSCQQEESLEVSYGILSNEDSQQESKQETSKPHNVWKKAKDKSTGRYYYFNCLTRKSTWTKPSELKLETDTLPIAAESKILKEPHEQGIEQELRNVWKKAKDPSSGRYYYYNRFNRETSWIKPQEVQTKTSTVDTRAVTEDQVFKESGTPKPKAIQVSSRMSLRRKSLLDEASLPDNKPKRSLKAVWGSFRHKKDFINLKTGK